MRPLFLTLYLTITVFIFTQSTSHIDVLTGFQVEIYASNLNKPRSLTVTNNDTVYVGSKSGFVYRVTPERAVEVVDSGLYRPVGVEYYSGDLYVTETGRLLIYRDVINSHKVEVLHNSLPDEDWHGYKYIRVGPDNRLYMNIGAPCNICNTKEYFGTILRMDLGGKNWEVYAQGVRNSVGFDWSPFDSGFWFTDNGADGLGENYPPDELNRVTKVGEHFGFPHTYRGERGSFTEPEWKLPAHVAALGMRFYSGSMFPDEYRGGVFIAEHGSWDREEEIGYRFSFISFKENKPIGYKIFLSGLERGGVVRGRPADLDFLSDGSMIISDDVAGVIYRVYFTQSLH